MLFKTALEESAQGLASLEFLKLDEFNLEGDKLKAYEFPLILIVPYVERQKPSSSGAWKSRITPFVGWILFKTDERTYKEYTSKQLEVTAVAPAKQLGKQFFGKLLQTDVIDSDWDIRNIEISYTPVYGLFDIYVHGVAFNIPELKIVENPSAC